MNHGNQDTNGQSSIDKHGKREAQCAAEAGAAVEGAGGGGRLQTPAARRGRAQGLEYIKQHKLQNPDNGREILADDKLEAVFGKKKVTMFEMNKHLAQHLS